MAPIIEAERIEDIAGEIIVLRGHKVLLDADLAALYGVTTKRLSEQVKRNRDPTRRACRTTRALRSHAFVSAA
jgi:hypothetical protein